MTLTVRPGHISDHHLMCFCWLQWLNPSTRAKGLSRQAPCTITHDHDVQMACRAHPPALPFIRLLWAKLLHEDRALQRMMLVFILLYMNHLQVMQ